MILFDEVVASVFGDAFNAYVFLVGLAEELVRLVVVGTELVILADFFFLACELEGNVVFGKICGFDLGTMLVPACGTI